MTTCPACGADARTFFTGGDVPTNSCLLLEDRDEAAGFPTGGLALAHCPSCGFITNPRFDQADAEYSDRYEETQAFSPTFVEFGRSLARRWVEEHDLAGKRVLEIGCGKGEFLQWMAEAGIGHGLGVDPGVHPERMDGPGLDRLDWRTGLYDDDFGPIDHDAVVCRHTLEHIADVAGFLRRIRRDVGDRDPVLLFELPDTQRVLDEQAFWDVYYEHCSYFTAGSLVRLFEREGFAVESVELAYDGQYLLLAARPARPGRSAPDLSSEFVDDLGRVAAGVEAWSEYVAARIDGWRERLANVVSDGGTVALWGGGSKAVAFLAGLGQLGGVVGAVDVNPHKQGRFLAGSGLEVLAPKRLSELRPGLVVAMNPVYTDEIRADLDRLGLNDVPLEAL